MESPNVQPSSAIMRSRTVSLSSENVSEDGFGDEVDGDVCPNSLFMKISSADEGDIWPSDS